MTLVSANKLFTKIDFRVILDDLHSKLLTSAKTTKFRMSFRRTVLGTVRNMTVICKFYVIKWHMPSARQIRIPLKITLDILSLIFNDFCL